MRLLRVRFRLVTLLSVVAGVAVVLAGFRTHGGTGAAIALIGASIYALARKRSLWPLLVVGVGCFGSRGRLCKSAGRSAR